mmetsp:Transcript_22020/g.67609  ORF Transcript_22020/g.67609 Transcript_22020/m.67609 type:complete len:203 (+) Transcript_22020:250-858(+)
MRYDERSPPEATREALAANPNLTHTTHRNPNPTTTPLVGVPLGRGRGVSAEFQGNREDRVQAAVPRLRHHLREPIPADGGARRRGAPEHVLQALHLLLPRVRPGGPARAASALAHRAAAREAVPGPCVGVPFWTTCVRVVRPVLVGFHGRGLSLSLSLFSSFLCMISVEVGTLGASDSGVRAACARCTLLRKRVRALFVFAR